MTDETTSEPLGFLGSLFGAGLAGAGIDNLLKGQGELQTDIENKIGGLQTAAVDGSNFTPFGVSSGTGNVSYTENGGMDFSTNPQMQAYINQMQDNADAFAGQAGVGDPNLGGMNQSLLDQMGLQTLGGSQQMLDAGNQAYGMGSQALTQGAGAPPSLFGDLSNKFGAQALGADPSQGLSDVYGTQALGAAQGLNVNNRQQRESEIFDRIRSIQAPQEERNQSALNRRLQSQGRMGVRTNEFGGTPEQLALSKAQSEASNSAAFQSMNQAGTEMDRDLGRATELAGVSQGSLDSILNRGGSSAGLAMGAQQGGQNYQQNLINRGLGLNQFGMGTQQGNENLSGARNQNLGFLQNLYQGNQLNDVNRQGAQQGLANNAMIGSFAPESQLFDAYAQAGNTANLMGAGQRQGAQISSDLGLGGLQALIGSQGNTNQLLGDLYGAGSSLVGGLGN